MAAAIKTFTPGNTGLLIGVVTKHSWAKFRVAIDWTQYLALNSSTIATSEWVAAGTATVIFDGADLADWVTSIDLAGGYKGERATLENRITFGDGSKNLFRVVVVVE